VKPAFLNKLDHSLDTVAQDAREAKGKTVGHKLDTPAQEALEKKLREKKTAGRRRALSRM
jgi:hypothetical protein